jgi:hypothetical protein
MVTLETKMQQPQKGEGTITCQAALLFTRQETVHNSGYEICANSFGFTEMNTKYESHTAWHLENFLFSIFL